MHFLSKTWSSASSKYCRAVYLILSLESMSPLHLTDGGSWRSPLRRQRAIRQNLGKHVSFKHIRCPVGLWLTSTRIKVFSLAEDRCSSDTLFLDTSCTGPDRVS